MEEPVGITQRVVIGQFLDDERLGQTPPDEDAEDNAAERHNPQGGDIVERIEEATAEEGAEVRQGTEAERAQRSQHDGGQGHIGSSTTAAGAVAIDEESGDLLVHGNGAGQGGQHQQDVEQQREDVAERRDTAEEGVEDLGQRDEDEAGAGIGRDVLHREHCGKDDETGENGHGGVDAYDIGCGLHQRHIGLEIAGVGAETADGYRKRKERLAERREYDGGIDLREIGFQQELHTGSSAGHGHGTDCQQEHDEEENGHQQFGETLDAILHSANDDDVGQQQESEGEEQRRPGGGAEGGEVGSGVTDAGKTSGRGIHGIFKHPSGYYRVVSKDERHTQHSGISG